MTDEIAVGNPLRLHELELTLLVRSDQEKDPAALGAVVFKYSLRQGWSVVRAATQEVVEIDGDDVVFEGIARIDTTNVRAEGALEALHVVCIRKFIVALAIRSESGIVTLWCEEERRPAPPPADHFCGDQLFFFC